MDCSVLYTWNDHSSFDRLYCRLDFSRKQMLSIFILILTLGSWLVHLPALWQFIAFGNRWCIDLHSNHSHRSASEHNPFTRSVSEPQLHVQTHSMQWMVHLGFHDHLEYFRFVGRVVGKALYDGIQIEPQFANFFLRKCLGGIACSIFVRSFFLVHS